jgi:hypothetical protein
VDAVLIGVGILALLMIIWWARQRKKKHHQHRPRAQMSWLREACKPPLERTRAHA